MSLTKDDKEWIEAALDRRFAAAAATYKASEPDANGCVQLEAVESFRSAIIAEHDGDAEAQKLIDYLPERFVWVDLPHVDGDLRQQILSSCGTHEGMRSARLSRSKRFLTSFYNKNTHDGPIVGAACMYETRYTLASPSRTPYTAEEVSRLAISNINGMLELLQQRRDEEARFAQAFE